ncbi:glycoside hydrolase family 31 protein [Maribellus mangrovi]|uniref:glycoside hydrolase family 31 protein n=1 Tax=Maribellus mangrovi TaxID=3133146 RepID=UPI0030EE5D8C
MKKKIGLFFPAYFLSYLLLILLSSCGQRLEILDQEVRLNVRETGDHSVRITITPTDFENEFPYTPALIEREYSGTSFRITKLGRTMNKKVGNMSVVITNDPLKVQVSDKQGRIIQRLTFLDDGSVLFDIDDNPILGMGEGGPRMGKDWENEKIEFDRRGRYHKMEPRWQSNAYGSRNPVAMLVGTGGWGVFVATPWVQVDLRNKEQGKFIPRNLLNLGNETQTQTNQQQNTGKGIPPAKYEIPGVYDILIFDAAKPENLMKELAEISGKAVLPPKWALGYMQSHRTLEDEDQMIDIVETFREKQIPVDALIYLGTGFCPRGWNTQQPSFDFNPEVFKREPSEVIDDLHDLNVKVSLHIVPWDRDKLPTLHGSIPPGPDELVDESHILNYWNQHLGLVNAGVDAWWPDEGDWFNLHERMKRHQMYYEGPVYTNPDLRPWSLHRNGYLGVARWGGWVWSGDTQSSWKTLEGQIAVGINHSLSLSPYWGSDIGGFYPGEKYTGEMYARWFQFGAFCPSFRSHGRTWWTSLPWGFGLSEMGPLENHGKEPSITELNNPAIETICRKYDELRYQLLPYNYTLAWEARETGMPFMRAMWLHYPDDDIAKRNGRQYLWGRDLLIAPVFEPDAKQWEVYLPEGKWYDWFTNTVHDGSQTITKKVKLSVMPIYVRAGAIIPIDPVREYVDEEVTETTTIRIYSGNDGSYTLYEDDGISNAYLDGDYNLTRFSWEDDSRKLVIEPKKSTSSTESVEKVYRILVLPEGETKKVIYKGVHAEYKL